MSAAHDPIPWNLASFPPDDLSSLTAALLEEWQRRRPERAPGTPERRTYARSGPHVREDADSETEHEHEHGENPGHPAPQTAELVRAQAYAAGYAAGREDEQAWWKRELADDARQLEVGWDEGYRVGRMRERMAVRDVGDT